MIFLHRTGSATPYARILCEGKGSKSLDGNFMLRLGVNENRHVEIMGLDGGQNERFIKAVLGFQRAHHKGALLDMEFT